MLWPMSRNRLGKEFHSLGPSAENTQRTHEFRCYDGMTNWLLSLKKRLIKVMLSQNKNISGAVYSASKYATDVLNTVPVSDRPR